MGKTFDELSKALAKGVSRRQALKGVFASLVGAIAGMAFGEWTASAARSSRQCAVPLEEYCKANGFSGCVVVNGGPMCVM